MIIFHQFFLPDLYYYPTSPNLTKSHAHIISQRSSPLPSLGRAWRWSEPEKKRRRRRERGKEMGNLSERAAGKSFAEGRSFNGNGRSVLRRGWPPWLVLVGRLRCIYV